MMGKYKEIKGINARGKKEKYMVKKYFSFVRH